MTRVHTYLYAPILAMVLFVGGWLALGTQAFLQPHAIVYYQRGDEIVGGFDRATPFGSVWAYWSSECQSTVSGIERRDSGQAYYQEAADPVIYAVVGPVLDCFRDGYPVIFRHTWQVKLFGVVPLRPVELVQVVELPPIVEDVK